MAEYKTSGGHHSRILLLETGVNAMTYLEMVTNILEVKQLFHINVKKEFVTGTHA